MTEGMKKQLNNHKLSISKLSQAFGMQRDAYYKFQRRNRRSEATKAIVLALVNERRKDQPREGAKKMHKAFKDEFIEKGIKLGRDALFDLLREMDMLVKPIHTINSTSIITWSKTWKLRIPIRCGYRI